MGARILYDSMRPKTEPLGPENIVGFTTGILTGHLLATGQQLHRCRQVAFDRHLGRFASRRLFRSRIEVCQL